VADIPGAVHDTMRSLCLSERAKPEQTVAVTAGSRGIANIDGITRAVVDELKSLRLQPFIVPPWGAMAAPRPRAAEHSGPLWGHRSFHGVPGQIEHGGGRDWQDKGDPGVL